jgi:hypothetical protein
VLALDSVGQGRLGVDCGRAFVRPSDQASWKAWIRIQSADARTCTASDVQQSQHQHSIEHTDPEQNADENARE